MWLSIYWFAWVNLGGSASYPGSPTTPWDMLFFNTQLQNSYFNVWDTLLTTPNPYENGLTFAEDPAVAFASIMNEDSLLWYDLGSIPSGELNILNTGFGTYFKSKYCLVDLINFTFNFNHDDDNFSTKINTVP
mgnify:CR=1 FL=1